MNYWGLPQTAEIGGVAYHINADFRDVLEIIKYLTDTTKSENVKWMVAISLFYDGEIPDEHLEEAAKFLSEFIDYGMDDGRPSPKLIDWAQDAQMIVADVNKVAGCEVRANQFLHWWTFLSYFSAIGEGQLSKVVDIRSKKAKGKKLDKSDMAYYRENKKKIDFQQPETPEKAATKAYFDKWL